MKNSSHFAGDKVKYITGAYCPLPRSGSESEIEVRYVTGAYSPLPGYENESEFVSDSPSEGFNEAPRVQFKQAGFFDLGISLLILAISGGSVYFIEKGQAETHEIAQQNVEIAATRPAETSIEKIASISPHGPGLSM
jgi:hypothetical protein